MKTVTLHEAKAHLPKLLAQARHGEEVFISGRRRPAVQLVPVSTSAGRQRGSRKSRILIGAEFFGPSLPDELGDWQD
jgi:prevent-host-death family protein